MADEIINKVANSGLITIDLEEFYMGVFRADFTTPNTVIWYSSVSINEPKPDFHKPNILFPCMKK